jgi:transposase
MVRASPPISWTPGSRTSRDGAKDRKVWEHAVEIVTRGCPALVAQQTKGAKDVLDPRCSGRDVHKDTVVACVRMVRDGAANSDVRTVDTTTRRPAGAVRLVGGERLDEINRQREWKPVWRILADGAVTLILANAAHGKTVPWPQDRRRRCVPAGRFVGARPDPRQRRAGDACPAAHPQAGGARAGQSRPAHPEDANLKLASALSQIMAGSGRATLQALIDGEGDPDKLLALRHRGV